MSLHRVSVLTLLLLGVGVSSTVANALPKVQELQEFSKNQEIQVAQIRSETRENPRVRPEAAENGLIDQLNLTQEQQQRINNINNEYSARISQTRQALTQARQDFNQTMDNSSASASQIRNKYSQLQQLQQQMNNLQLDKDLALREVLTVQQRTRYAQIKAQSQNNRDNSSGNSTRTPQPRNNRDNSSGTSTRTPQPRNNRDNSPRN